MGGELGLGCEGAAITAGCTTAKLDLEDYVTWGIDLLKVRNSGHLFIYLLR